MKDIELVFTDAPMGTFSSLEKARLRAIDYGAQIFIWGRIIKDPPGVAFNPIIQSTVNDIVSFDVKYPDLREFQHEEEAFAKAFDNISNGLADALLFGIGLTFHELGKYESSIDCLQRFSSEKNNPTALYYLANALFSIKKYEEAIRYCDLGIRSWQKDGSKVPKHKYHVLKFTSLIFLWRELEDNSLLERALGELELAEECDDLCPGDKEIFASQKELVMDKKEELDSKGIKSRLI